MTTTKKAQTKPHSSGKAGRRPPPADGRWKKGQSGNPGGRKPNKESPTYWLREWGGMTGAQASKLCRVWAKELAGAGDDVPLVALAMLKTWMGLVNEPTPGMLGHVLDRLDGAVTQKIEGDGTQTIVRVVYERSSGEAEKPSPAPTGDHQQPEPV